MLSDQTMYAFTMLFCWWDNRHIGETTKGEMIIKVHAFRPDNVCFHHVVFARRCLIHQISPHYVIRVVILYSVETIIYTMYTFHLLTSHVIHNSRHEIHIVPFYVWNPRYAPNPRVHRLIAFGQIHNIKIQNNYSYICVNKCKI